MGAKDGKGDIDAESINEMFDKAFAAPANMVNGMLANAMQVRHVV